MLLLVVPSPDRVFTTHLVAHDDFPIGSQKTESGICGVNGNAIHLAGEHRVVIFDPFLADRCGDEGVIVGRCLHPSCDKFADP